MQGLHWLASMGTQATNSDDLPEREAMFVKLYCGKARRNITKAAIGAGYNPKSAGSHGCALLKKPRVMRAIELLNTNLAARLDLEAYDVLAEYMSIGFSNILDYVDENGMIDISALTREQGAAISEITVTEVNDPNGGKAKATQVKFKLHPKVPALEALAKFLGVRGVGTNKMELTGPGGSPLSAPVINVVFIDPEDAIRDPSLLIEGESCS